MRTILKIPQVAIYVALLSCFYSIKVNATQVSGSVSGIWTKANSPYIISGTVKIDKGSTLTIEPGTQIQLSNNLKSMTVEGTLIANGAINDSIQWLSTSNSSIDYGNGIWVTGGMASISCNTFTQNIKVSVQNDAQIEVAKSYFKRDSIMCGAGTISVQNCVLS